MIKAGLEPNTKPVSCCCKKPETEPEVIYDCRRNNRNKLWDLFIGKRASATKSRIRSLVDEMLIYYGVCLCGLKT